MQNSALLTKKSFFQENVLVKRIILYILLGVVLIILALVLSPKNEWKPVDDDADAAGAFLMLDTDSETAEAFAFGNTCFHEIDEDHDGTSDFSDWGWTIGPLSESATPYAFPIYADAMDCDVGRGELVGAIDILYTAGTASLAYSTVDGFALKQTFLYVGPEQLARNERGDLTVDPGEFPMAARGRGNSRNATYTVDGLSGNIYVVAHADVMVGHRSRTAALR